MTLRPRNAPAEPETEELGGGLAERAYIELEERIVTLVYQPGTVLSELALSKQLGIGRTPIREALLRLAYEGLVVIIPRRGVLVSEIDVNKHFRLLEFRREVERLAVRMACRRATDEQCRKLLVIAEEMEAAGKSHDATAFIRTDQRMDRLVYSAACNEYASKSLAMMSSLTRRFWFRYHSHVIDVELCAGLHARIARDVANRQADAAAEGLDALIDYIEDMTHASVGPERKARSASVTRGSQGS